MGAIIAISVWQRSDFFIGPDAITVLRGAAFNAFILFSLALFGSIGKLKERWPKHRVLVLPSFLPAAMAAIYTL